MVLRERPDNCLIMKGVATMVLTRAACTVLYFYWAEEGQTRTRWTS